MDEEKVPVSPETQEKIARLAERTQLSPTEVVERAVDAYETKMFFVEMDDAYANLKAAAEVWSRYQAEHEEWLALREDYEESKDEMAARHSEQEA